MAYNFVFKALPLSTFLLSPVVDCGVPPSVPNASPGQPSSTMYQGTVTYTCDTGVLVGGATVTCEASGDWSTPPTCLGENVYASV